MILLETPLAAVGLTRPCRDLALRPSVPSLARLTVASIPPARPALPEVRLRALPALGHTAYRPPAPEVRALYASSVRSVLRMEGWALGRTRAEAVEAGDVRL